MGVFSWLFGGESHREQKERWARIWHGVSGRDRHTSRDELFHDVDRYMKRVDERGYSPLMIAAHHGNRAVVEYCLRADAETQKVLANFTGNDETPLMVAVHQCPKSQRFDHQEARQPYLSILRLLLDRGALVDTQSSTGLTALMLAAKRRDVEVGQILLGYGATVDLLDKRRFSAEAYAQRARCHELVELLQGTPPHLHSDWRVRLRAARDTRTQQVVLEQLANDSDWLVHVGLAENWRAPECVLELLSRSPQVDVRRGVARNRSSPASVLDRLKTDADGEVRRHVAENPRTPTG